MGVGTATTQDATQPQVSADQKVQAQATATNKMPVGYGTMVLLAMIGILVGAKFAMEK